VTDPWWTSALDVVVATVREVVDEAAGHDTSAGDSLARVMVEMEVEHRLGVDVPRGEQGRWTTPRELAAIVERTMVDRRWV
jgi:acyl carrier protein